MIKIVSALVAALWLCTGSGFARELKVDLVLTPEERQEIAWLGDYIREHGEVGVWEDVPDHTQWGKPGSRGSRWYGDFMWRPLSDQNSHLHVGRVSEMYFKPRISACSGVDIEVNYDPQGYGRVFSFKASCHVSFRIGGMPYIGNWHSIDAFVFKDFGWVLVVDSPSIKISDEQLSILIYPKDETVARIVRDEMLRIVRELKESKDAQ